MAPVTLPIAAAAVGVVAILSLGSVQYTPGDEAHPYGVTQTLHETDGAVAAYTVNELGPSIDPVREPVTGLLFEATVTVEARQGTVVPEVSMFYARSEGGPTYRALPDATTADGLARALLRQGERATGRIYFDVVADIPDSVVANNGMSDLMVWVGDPSTTVAPPPAQRRHPAIPVMLTPDTNPVPA